MLKEHQYVLSRVSMGLDLALAAAAVLVAHALRNHVLAPYLLPDVFQAPSRLTDYAWLIWALPLLMVLFLRHNRYYSSHRVSSFGGIFRIVAVSALETSVAAMAISFFSEGRGGRPADNVIAGENVSRGVILILPIVLTILITVKTFAVRRVLVHLRKSGKNWRSVILVGSGDTLLQFIKLIKDHPFWGFQFAGIIDDNGGSKREVEGVRVIGTLKDFWAILEHTPVDEVVFIPASTSLDELAPYFEGCEEMGVRTRLSLNFFQHTIARPVLDTMQEVPVVTYSPTKELNWALLFKYAFDRIAAAIAILLLSPVFIVTALLVKLTSQSWRDPIFFGQTRSGLHGKPFTLWKFRSMKINADKELDKLKALNEMQGPVFKIKEDPRITKVGKWIRKLSVDELPQLYNVLCGDMSLVGPRPPIPKEVEQYDRWQRRRLSMKPGITCLWQVMGRNHLSFDTWMKLDLQYIDNWSLMLDFKILCRTVYVVATGYGAM